MCIRSVFQVTSLVAVLTGCASPVSTSDSGVKHEFGETSNPQATTPGCIQYKDTNQPEALAYVKKIAKYLTDKNPQTFKGAFAFEKFCFGVNETYFLTNAAMIDNGSLFVYPGLLLTMKSDAHIAAVLAHEFAHFTMAHYARKVSQSTYEREKEADEVGNEFYTRAGFTRSGFTGMFAELSKKGSPSDCSKTFGSPDPDKHPRDCERIANIQAENGIHNIDYRKFSGNVEFIDKSGDLLKVQKILQVKKEREEKRINDLVKIEVVNDN